jgi:hypothetical protein
MAAHFVADFDVFVAVCSENPKTTPKDAGLLREIRNKLSKFTQYEEFAGSPEDANTFRVVLDLEQMIGREIIWLRGESFEELVRQKSLLPNMKRRICTSELKMQPIARFIYEATGGGKVYNRVGIRIDESRRIKSEGFRTQTIDIPISTEGKRKKWLKEYEFAEASYPLVFDDNGSLQTVKKAVIYQWASESGLIFPESSNCQFCFNKSVLELLENQQSNPLIFEAGAEMEEWLSKKKGRTCTMKKDLPLSRLATMQKPTQQFQLFFGGESCESTFCSD